MKTTLQRHHLEEMIERSAGGRILVAAAFDGALAPVVSSPEAARIPEDTAETLQVLAGSGQVLIAVLSGRRLEDLQSRVQFPAVLCGNHGLEIAGKNISFEHPEASARAGLIAEAAEEAAKAIAPWSGAWVENKRLTATVHFSEVDRKHHCVLMVAVRRAMARFGVSVGLRAAHQALDVHPRAGWTTGNAIHYIRQELGLESSPVLCIGDDNLDEAMFRAVEGELTVHVGKTAPKVAQFHMPDENAVSHTLSNLVELLLGPRSLMAAVPSVALR